MSRSGWIHGSAVDKKTRTLRYLSPSGMQLGDMSTDQGCGRKFYYTYVEGLKEPETPQQRAGTADHAIVENYLITGQRVFSPRVAKGVHLLPPPGPHLDVEHDMIPYFEKDGKPASGLHLAPLRASGIPIVGRIDLLHDLGINYGAQEGEDRQDPEGTVEVCDHKFTKNLRYAKKGHELAKTIQMVTYGEYVFTAVDGSKFVRLSHYTYPFEGNAVKSTVRVTRETTNKFFTEHIEPLARSLADYVKEPTPHTVPGNIRACKAFGKLCMHASYCTAGGQVGLGAHVGQTASNSLLQAINKRNDMALIPGKSLLAHIKTPPAADKTAELAKLKEEERLARIPEWFPETFKAILSYGKGQPQISGEAAKIYAAFRGHPEPKGTQGFGGTAADDGEPGLSDVNITTAQEFQDLLGELTEAFGPPNVTQEPETEEEVVTQTVTNSLVAPDAPEIALNTSAEVPESKPEPVKETVATTKKRKSKAEKEAELVAQAREEDATTKGAQTVSLQPLTAGEAQLVAPKTAAPAVDSVSVFIDCVISGGGHIADMSLEIERIVGLIASKFDLDDIRAGGPQHALGFGKWRATLAAAIRGTDWAPGVYYFNARGNEIYEEAAQALRSVCRDSGGMWVLGGGR